MDGRVIVNKTKPKPKSKHNKKPKPHNKKQTCFERGNSGEWIKK
jgi:hypothetical protein